MTRGWNQVEILNPRGLWSSLASKRKGTPSRASVASNVRFSPAVVKSRPGTATVTASTGKVMGRIFNWITTGGVNYAIYNDGTNIIRYKQSDGTKKTLWAVGAYYPSFADLGDRLYMAAGNLVSPGAGCVIHDGAEIAGAPNVDVAFYPPIDGTLTPTDDGAGLCTVGTHYFGWVFQTRMGFSGRPGPVGTSPTFTPASVTLASDQRKISVAVSMDTGYSSGGTARLYLIMTRADNPNKWFWVPDVSVAVPYNTVGWTTTLTVSISDEDLASRATSADDQLDLISYGSYGAPFYPTFLVPYGKRMVYGVSGSNLTDLPNGTAVISDIDAPQQGAVDRNAINNGSGRAIKAAFPLASDLYFTGPGWTTRVTDNGDYPVTWGQPATVSDAIGAPYPNCVCYKTGGQYVWVAAESGLYRFDGAYPQHPITYLVSDYWARINWTQAEKIIVVEDSVNLKVYVAAPLDAATEPSHLFVIDFTNGMTYSSCDISIDTFPLGFSSIGLIREYLTDRSVIWIGPSAAGNIVRFDETSHNDTGWGASPSLITSVWESGYILDGQPSLTTRLGTADLWVRGDGALIHQWKGLDGTPSVTPSVTSAGCVLLTDMASAPGQEYRAKSDLVSENMTLRFSTAALNAWMELSGFKCWVRPARWGR